MRATHRWSAAAALTVGLVVAANAQPPGGGRGMGMGGMGGGPAQLVQSKTVLAEVKATDEQAAKLKEWAKEYGTKQMAKMRETFQELQGLDPMEMRTKMGEIQAKATAEAYKEIGTVLKDEQVKRLKQIDVQFAGMGAFMRTDVRDALKITDDQREKFQTIQMGVFGEMRDLREEYGIQGFGPPKLDSAKQKEYDRKLAAITNEAMTKMADALTDDQKKAWKDLTGDKVDVAKIRSEMPAPQFGKKKKDD
ncbi:MAG: hypothetical protein U0871_23315 [Gemmataceae bacterium]